MIPVAKSTITTPPEAASSISITKRTGTTGECRCIRNGRIVDIGGYLYFSGTVPAGEALITGMPTPVNFDSRFLARHSGGVVSLYIDGTSLKADSSITTLNFQFSYIARP